MSNTRSNLRGRLADYDGRAVTLLGEAEAALGEEPGFVDALIALAADGEGNISSGATWLLKSALEQGRRLSVDQVKALCSRLPDITAWDAQLHICQSVQYCTLPADCAHALARWLDPLLGHDRPFLRAWSMDAFYRLSQQHPAYRDAFAKALASAEKDEAASVRARARKLV